MRARTAWLAAFVLAIASILWATPDRAVPKAPTSTQCEEDDPCWQPATMGNGCWGEPNADQPSGIEVICAAP